MVGKESISEQGAAERKLLPSEFMRWRRPECYSDSEASIAYELDPKLLEYTLDSITSRNEHHDFELFCRHLCQRAICPNLRPATGPEGGGDGKVDTETFPVSDEITTLTYIGTPQPGDERWGFAFSAKKQWTASGITKKYHVRNQSS